MDPEGAQLRVLRRDRVGGGRLVEEVPRDGSRERDDGDPGVGCHGRDHLEERRELPGPALWCGADDHGRPRLDDEPGDREAERSRVGAGQLARAADLPGVDGGVPDRGAVGDEGEDARIASRWSVFEGHTSVGR